jgi:hypothetical protein
MVNSPIDRTTAQYEGQNTLDDIVSPGAPRTA